MAAARARSTRSATKRSAPVVDRSTSPEEMAAPKLPSTPASKKRAAKSEPSTPAAAGASSAASTQKPSPSLRKKLEQVESLGQSPFPTYARPTPKECELVLKALEDGHGGPRERPAVVEKREGGGSNCGLVPDVLDALVRTILSQNTTNKNSSAAKRGLNETFGNENYEAIRKASVEDVAAAIVHGGLADRKATVIKRVLDDIYEKHGALSLEHLRHVSEKDALRELVTFDGVGMKTASCVLLFTLGHQSFAVDTHVFRLARALGWIPAKANREQAFLHLDTRIPPAFKYGLHTLLITEGRSCAECAAGKLTAPPIKHCSLKSFLRGHGAKAAKDLVTADGEAKPEVVKLEKAEEGNVVDADAVNSEYEEDVKPRKRTKRARVEAKVEPEDGKPAGFYHGLDG